MLARRGKRAGTSHVPAPLSYNDVIEQVSPASLRTVETLNDHELARRISHTGSVSATWAEEELCRRFAPRVRLYGLRHLHDEQAAADLMQRVLLLTIQKLRAGAVRELDRIGSFILGVARTMAHEARRQNRREEPLPDTDPLPFLPPEPDTFAAERLRGCLETLPERERSVVVLTYYGEQSSAEIGASLALAEGNIRIIRHRAIARLRECIGVGAAA